MDITQLLAFSVKNKASDLHLSAGLPPMIRVHGDVRRINVEPSCLACHGTKASRPAFIKANYPDDKAFDFTVGDLRGMYAVHLPEVQAALAAAEG